jgi:hypothetical protein
MDSVSGTKSFLLTFITTLQARAPLFVLKKSEILARDFSLFFQKNTARDTCDP